MLVSFGHKTWKWLIYSNTLLSNTWFNKMLCNEGRSYCFKQNKESCMIMSYSGSRSNWNTKIYFLYSETSFSCLCLELLGMPHYSRHMREFNEWSNHCPSMPHYMLASQSGQFSNPALHRIELRNSRLTAQHHMFHNHYTTVVVWILVQMCVFMPQWIIKPERNSKIQKFKNSSYPEIEPMPPESKVRLQMP